LVKACSIKIIIYHREETTFLKISLLLAKASFGFYSPGKGVVAKPRQKKPQKIVENTNLNCLFVWFR